MLVDIARYANTAGFCETLHTRSDVYAVTIEITAFDNDVTEADANADIQRCADFHFIRLILRQPCFAEAIEDILLGCGVGQSPYVSCGGDCVSGGAPQQ